MSGSQPTSASHSLVKSTFSKSPSFESPISSSPVKKKSSILNAFKLIDSQSKGFITESDIWNVIKRLQLDQFISRVTANKIFKDLDSQQQSKVPFDKFFNAILSRQEKTDQQTVATKAFITPGDKIKKLLNKIKKHPKLQDEKELIAQISWAIDKLSSPDRLYDVDVKDGEFAMELGQTGAQDDILNWLQEYSVSSEKRRKSQHIVQARENQLIRQKTRQLTSQNSLNLLAQHSSSSTYSSNAQRLSIASAGLMQQDTLKLSYAMQDAHHQLIALYHVKYSDVEEADNFDFDIFNFAQKIGRQSALSLVATHLMMQHHLFEILDDSKFEAFIKEVFKGYRKDIPYHTDLHAADVAYSCNLFITKGKLDSIIDMESLDIAAFLLGAIIHDFKHPGLTNVYLQNSGHSLAIRYNDISVLQNYHIAQTFKLIQKTEFNIFSNLSPSECKLMRKRIIQCVLATDMAKHQEKVSRLMSLVQSNQISNGQNTHLILSKDTDLKKFDSQQFMMDICLHAADLGSPVKKFSQSKRWAHLVAQQFWKQGDLQKKQNLPVSFLCDRQTTSIEFPKSQIGFLKGVIMPFYKPIAQIMPTMRVFVQNGQENSSCWQGLIEEYRANAKQIFKISEMNSIAGAILPKVNKKVEKNQGGLQIGDRGLDNAANIIRQINVDGEVKSGEYAKEEDDLDSDEDGNQEQNEPKIEDIPNLSSKSSSNLGSSAGTGSYANKQKNSAK